MSAYSVTIQPANVPQIATRVDLYLQYIFNATDCTVSAIIYDASGNYLETQSVYISPAVYSTWTTDDSIIINYVLAQLGFTAA